MVTSQVLSESCGLVGSEDGSRSKDCGFESTSILDGSQSHIGMINTPNLDLPRCFKWIVKPIVCWEVIKKEKKTSNVITSKKVTLNSTSKMVHFMTYKFIYKTTQLFNDPVVPYNIRVSMCRFSHYDVTTFNI